MSDQLVDKLNAVFGLERGVVQALSFPCSSHIMRTYLVRAIL